MQYLEVTQKEIDNAIRHLSTDCPIALAAKNIFTDAEYIHYYRPDNGLRWRLGVINSTSGLEEKYIVMGGGRYAVRFDRSGREAISPRKFKLVEVKENNNEY